MIQSLYINEGEDKMSKPSHQDALIMLQCAQWNALTGVQEAMNWMYSDEFELDYAKFKDKFPPGSEGYARANKICGWYETIGTLSKHGLFNEELLFDWLYIRGSWERIKGFALGVREEVGNPHIYENFEALANAQEE